LDEILEFVVSFFANLVERRIDQGLYRSYVERDDDLTTVRGRIAFAEDLRRNHVTRHRTYCRYDEFSWDVPENQVIRQVLHLLGGWGFGKELRLRLRGLDAALSEVTPTVLPLGSLDRFQYNRFNEDYRQMHRFCRLFLEGASLSEENGTFDFRTFLVDMDKLFERFVTQVLRERAGARVGVDDQVATQLGYEQKVPIRPDIVVSNGGRVGLVADCKYKRLEPGEFKNHDVYQMHAYCTAMGAQRGLLIYPVHATVVKDSVTIRNTDTTIRQATIDLGKEEIGKLDEECETLARTVFDWVHPDVV
jgi:5-methylcytosine-specific restriction enzyme subunit McrC